MAQRKKKILLIDDQESIRHAVDAVIEPLGCNLTYRNKVEGAKTVKLAQNADLVILDLMMPGESGYQFLDRLKGLGVKVLVLSAHDTAKAAREAFVRGALGYSTKPIDPEDLRNEIRRLTHG